jgi:hypothetical protein
MVGAQRFFADPQSALIQGLGLGAAVFIRVKRSEAVEAVRHVGMIRPERLLKDPQGVLVKRLGLGVAAFVRVACSESGEARVKLWVVAA